MKVMPCKKVREQFKLVYEVKGCQKAVDFLAQHYGIRRMKIVVDGRRVGNRNDAVYGNSVAYFKKKGLDRSNVLHEFYHHLACAKKWEMSRKKEEREAERYAHGYLSRGRKVRKNGCFTEQRKFRQLIRRK